MSVIQYIFRVILTTIQQPGVTDALTATGRKVAAATTRVLIREIANGFSRFEQKRTTPTVR